MADPDRARAQAGLTGAEDGEILRGREAERILAEPVIAKAFAELAAYYAHKQLQAGDDAGEVMRWQASRVALEDVERTFRGYVQTGQAAAKRVGRFQRILEAMKHPPSRMARFRAATE